MSAEQLALRLVPARYSWSMGLRVGFIATGVACAVMAGIGVWSVHEDRPRPITIAPVVPAALPAPAPVVHVPPVMPAAPQTLIAAVLPPPTVESPDPRETEVDLLWALHEQRLCRTGSVDVVLASSGVPTIRGVVDTAAQLSALKILVGEESHGPFAIDIRTSDEPVPTVSGVSGVSAPAAQTEAQAPEGERLIRFWLKGRGITGDPAAAELSRISNQAVRLANEAWVESWALQRLVDRFGPEQRRALKLASRARLFEMAQSHFEALDKVLRQESDLLLPILGDGAPGSAGSPSLFADVARLSAMIQDTFAGTSKDGEQRLRDLIRVTLAEASRWSSKNLVDWDTRPEP